MCTLSKAVQWRIINVENCLIASYTTFSYFFMKINWATFKLCWSCFCQNNLQIDLKPSIEKNFKNSKMVIPYACTMLNFCYMYFFPIFMYNQGSGCVKSGMWQKISNTCVLLILLFLFVKYCQSIYIFLFLGGLDFLFVHHLNYKANTFSIKQNMEWTKLVQLIEHIKHWPL